MSFFDSIKESFTSNTVSDVFIYPPNNDPIQPAAFGFWTVGWSHELALKFLEGIKNNNENKSLPVMGLFYSYLNLVAFYTAIHWVYAIVILQIPPASVEKMKIGLEDGIGGLTDQDSQPLKDVEKRYFKNAFINYLDAIETDYRTQDDIDPSVFNPDVSFSSAKFIQMIEDLPLSEDNKITEAEKTYIGFLLGDLPLETFTMMKNIGVRYIV